MSPRAVAVSRHREARENLMKAKVITAKRQSAGAVIGRALDSIVTETGIAAGSGRHGFLDPEQRRAMSA